jgi:hypothetical protein
VDAFDRTGEGQRCSDFPSTGFRGGKAKNRPEPFSAGEDTVAHRLVNGRGSRRSLRQKLIERTINFLLPDGEIVF